MIDHIVWYASDLEQGINDIEARFGIRATRGGTHTGLGTHNALLSLGERSYFEIIAPDPRQIGGAWRDALLQSGQPGLFHWAVAVPNLNDVSEASRDDYLHGQAVVSASRESAALGKLSWKLLMPQSHRFGALIPFLIDWENSPHPAQALPRGCHLKSISVYSDEKQRLEDFFQALNLAVNVYQDSDPHFAIVLETPRGEVTLESIRPLPGGLAF
jgi:hypothetical protein